MSKYSYRQILYWYEKDSNGCVSLQYGACEQIEEQNNVYIYCLYCSESDTAYTKEECDIFSNQEDAEEYYSKQFDIPETKTMRDVIRVRYQFSVDNVAYRSPVMHVVTLESDKETRKMLKERAHEWTQKQLEMIQESYCIIS